MVWKSNGSAFLLALLRSTPAYSQTVGDITKVCGVRAGYRAYRNGGMDPLELAKKLGPRVVEYHIKDVKPENKGGAKTRLAKMDGKNNPCFFPLGSGGVDFIGLKNYLDSTQWKGYLTVELDTSPRRPPKESAAISRKYIEDTLKIKV